MILRNLTIIGSVKSSGKGQVQIYPTSIANSIALVHVAMIDDSKFTQDPRIQKKETADRGDTFPQRKIVLDLVHRLSDSYRIERIASIGLKDQIINLFKLGERNLLVITKSRTYTFSSGKIRKRVSLSPEMIASSHIYGLYKKHEICDSLVSSDQRFIVLTVRDFSNDSFSLNIYDL